MNEGYVKSWRSLADHFLWLESRFTRGQAWWDLILLANHKDSYFMVRGNRVDVKRGQLGWSILSLSKRWKWDQGTVRRFLAFLKSELMIDYKCDSRTTLITITNYNKWQDNTKTDTITETEQKQNRNHTYKNVENVKNEKKTTIAHFTKPTAEDLTAYSKSIGFDLNTDAFLAHYDMKGWLIGRTPMKDWKAAVRTWKIRAEKDKGAFNDHPGMKQRPDGSWYVPLSPEEMNYQPEKVRQEDAKSILERIGLKESS